MGSDLTGLVIDWYAGHARDLPWRRTRDHYAIVVSEVMLQQTQVERVIPKFQEFLEAFPSFEALAEASPGDAIRAWAGLGYNRRAVRLHRLAQAVVRENDGMLPDDVESLRRLPGLGAYTAAAIACFAFGAAVPLADTNIYRVLSRVVHGMEAPSRKVIDGLAVQLVPEQGASEWYQGLMDIGAAYCTVTTPRCGGCPLRDACTAAPLLEAGAPRGVAEASVPYAAKQGVFRDSRRYYRGRILATLRELGRGEEIGVEDLGAGVRDDFDPAEHAAWLDEVLAALAGEGLVRLSDGPNGTRVALP